MLFFFTLRPVVFSAEILYLLHPSENPGPIGGVPAENASTPARDLYYLRLKPHTMIPYKRHTLSNGLMVAVNRDRQSKLAAVNILYKVGARNEDPARTGFAHLFEHLMFRGTRDVPDFDLPVQMARRRNGPLAGSRPHDRTRHLARSARNRKTGRHRGVQAALSQSALRRSGECCCVRWPILSTLTAGLRSGLRPTMWPARRSTRCAPSTAAGTTPRTPFCRSRPTSTKRVFELAERYFAPIADTPSAAGPLPAEPEQTAERRLEVERDVPATAVTVAYPMGDRLSRDFYLGDMASDILSGGDSARLYERLVKRDRLFSSVNAYITGDVDPGLFVLTGHLLPGRTVEEAEAAFAREIEEMQTLPASDYEIEKVKNKFEANALFGELNVMNKAMNLGYYEMLGDPGLVNREVELYRSVTAAELTDFARRTFRAARRSTHLSTARHDETTATHHSVGHIAPRTPPPHAPERRDDPHALRRGIRGRARQLRLPAPARRSSARRSSPRRLPTC